MNLRGERATPAVTMEDGHDYVKTDKYVLFGHHFAAIAAAGPLLGPVLAAQFGHLPGVDPDRLRSAGGVHDMVVLFASVRHKGKSLSVIAETEVGKAAGKQVGQHQDGPCQLCNAWWPIQHDEVCILVLLDLGDQFPVVGGGVCHQVAGLACLLPD